MIVSTPALFQARVMSVIEPPARTARRSRRPAALSLGQVRGCSQGLLTGYHVNNDLCPAWTVLVIRVGSDGAVGSSQAHGRRRPSASAPARRRDADRFLLTETFCWNRRTEPDQWACPGSGVNRWHRVDLRVRGRRYARGGGNMRVYADVCAVPGADAG